MLGWKIWTADKRLADVAAAFERAAAFPLHPLLLTERSLYSRLQAQIAGENTAG